MALTHRILVKEGPMQKLTLAIVLFAGSALHAAETLTVYAYDSFTSKGSLGAAVRDAFEKKSGAKTELVSFPSAGEALNQVALEGKKTRADLVVGVDDSLLARAREMDAFEKLEPFDYGFLALVYDSRRTTPPPAGTSLRDFASNKAFAKKVVIEDPRTSSIGLSFLLWTRCLFEGAAWEGFWKDFSKQLVTVAPGWSGAYGLFLKKEADFVMSYTTSPAYHVEKEKTDAFHAVIFPEGHYRQTESVGIVRASAKKALAAKWVALLLSDEIQAKVPLTQWMYPVAKSVALPKSFAALPAVPKVLTMDAIQLGKSKREWLRQWTAAVTDKK